MPNVSIYFSQEVYDKLLLLSSGDGVSGGKMVSRIVGNYLSGNKESQMDRIERKLDSLIMDKPDRGSMADQIGPSDRLGDEISKEEAKDDSEIIVEGQAKLDAVRKKRNIKESLTGHVGSYSKGFQVGKK